jgi:hypothetical protein
VAKLQVTDHALLRWLERTGALDVEQLRGLLSQSLDRAHVAGATLGVHQFLILADDLIYLVRGGKLITVLKDSSLHEHVKVLSRDHGG